MTSANAIRTTVAIGVIVFAAAVSVATGGDQGKLAMKALDPSVPPAVEVLHGNDGRNEGNVNDLTY